MSIGSRIKQRREELGLTQPELAKIIGVSKGTIGNYETGLSAPNEKNFFKLFDALKCDANFLYQDDMAIIDKENINAKELQHIKKYRTLDEHGKKMVDFTLNEEYTRCTAIPEEDEEDDEPEIEIRHSYYKVSAGTGFDLGNDDDWETIYIPDTPEGQRADFALTIQGNSMEPIYYDGDIVLVKQQPAIDIGEVGIFTINGAGYIKKYGGDRLISLNAEYDDIEFSDDDNIKCCGKVIGRV